MNPINYQYYVVAWDWLLFGLYSIMWIVVAICILIVVITEIEDK